MSLGFGYNQFAESPERSHESGGAAKQSQEELDCRALLPAQHAVQAFGLA